MKISFWIPAVVLYVVKVAFSNSVQVGTVLFTTTDLVKRCWTESDKSLLKARFIMQDVLPDPDCIDFSKPEAAVVLLDYFHACYQIISTSTYGKVQNLMYIALSDALGGYLRAYVLPFTRKAYYAGQIQYSEAKKLFQLYDDIRMFLKTSGLGWAEPQRICYRKLRAKPLMITGGSFEACNQLYTIERGKLHCINPAGTCSFQGDTPVNVHPSKSSKESLRDDSDAPEPCRNPPDPTSSSPKDCKHPRNTTSPLHTATTTSHPFYQNDSRQDPRDADRSVNRTCRCENIFHKKAAPFEAKRVIIPLPVLDDCEDPHSIAVPFRRQPLRNLRMRNSAFILEYYYIAVIKCFIAKGNTRTDIMNFNAQFHAWLVSQVFPRLSDEKWYPAFGGVLRVMETIRKFGAETTVKDSVLHDIAYMFGQGVPFDITDNPKLTGKEKVREATDMDFCDHSSKRHYLTTMLIVSLIWIFIFCTCAFYCQATRGRNLLYEGYSEVSSPSRGRREYERGKERFIDFQFLVRFFKKRDDFAGEDQVYQCFVENDREKKTFWEGLLHDTKGSHSPDGRQQKGFLPLKGVEEGKYKERGRLVMTGQGDVPLLVINSPEKLQHSFVETWPYQFPPSKGAEKAELLRQENHGEGEGKDEVQMLWKKPSNRLKRDAALKDEEKTKGRFSWSLKGTTTSEDVLSKTSSNSCSLEDETKGSSTEKRTSTCCCSEGCRHSNATSTKSSSQTQVGAGLSSAAARHTAREKTSAQESSAESESEGDDDSYSSESDY